MEGGEEEEVEEDPNGVSIEPSAQSLLLVGTTTGHFLLSGWGNGREVIAPLTNEEVGGGGSQTTLISAPWPRCAMGRPFEGEAMGLMVLHGWQG